MEIFLREVRLNEFENLLLGLNFDVLIPNNQIILTR